MTSLYKEVERATYHINRHMDNLTGVLRELDVEYGQLFESLLDRAQDFDEEAMADFRKLGRQRRLRKLNITTIMSLLYLRMCIWVMMDGAELETQLEPSLAIERLRSVNKALRGSSETQVKRLDKLVMMMSRKLAHSPPDQSRNIILAIRSVDDDVGKIFGEAISARS